jgi:endonuclease/exonuclease/phosphatase family metal-dependent hydrolase
VKLVTWNVQWCRGVDGRVDPARIVAEARRLADFDVLCIQEVADNFPDPRLKGSVGEDQFAKLEALLPGYTIVPGVAVDHPGDGTRRRRFGNAIASRLPVKQVYRHSLRYLCDPGVPGMPRLAIEAVVAAPFGDLRVITTHLEYYSFAVRIAQVDSLRQAYADGHARARDARITENDGGPFQTFLRPRATIITGDFNLEPDSPEYARICEPFEDDAAPLHDAWRIVHPERAHPPTFRVYEKETPGDPEMHCDFVFVSDEIRDRVRAIEVDQATQASDHQPVIVTLE